MGMTFGEWLIASIKAFAKNHEGFRKFARKVKYGFDRRSYERSAKGMKTDRKLVYFNTFVGRSYGDSPKAIYEYMLSSEKFKDYSFVWMFREPEKYGYLRSDRTSIVKFESKEEAMVIGMAGYWITNYRMLDKYVPRDDQIYVQCWHGTPLKKLGYDLTSSDNAMNSFEEICDRYDKDAERFSFLVSPSPYATERFISAWNLKASGKEDAVIEVGYPRNDRLVNHTAGDIEKIKEKLGLSGDAGKIVLYAPTWRDDQFDAKKGYTYDLPVDFNALLDALGPEHVILFRAHYLVAKEFDFARYEGKIIDVSSYDDINDLYIASDMLVTDYSSVMFDYAVLRKPMAFFMYDMEAYRDRIRGLYFDPAELPGPVVKTESELAECIKELTSGDFAPDEKYKEFNEKYDPLDDGEATERAVEKIFQPETSPERNQGN